MGKAIFLQEKTLGQWEEVERGLYSSNLLPQGGNEQKNITRLISGEETLLLIKETLIIVRAVGTRDHFFAQDSGSRNRHSYVTQSPSSPQTKRVFKTTDYYSPLLTKCQLGFDKIY